MSETIIVAVEAERVRLTRRLAQLDELERAARAYAGDDKPRGVVTPPKKARVPRKPKPGKISLQILNLLRESDGPLLSRDIQRLTGCSQSPVDTALRGLFGAGKVLHDDGSPRRWSLMPSVGNGNGSALQTDVRRDSIPEPEPRPLDPVTVVDPPPPSDDVAQAYLERRLLALLQRAPRTVADAARGVDADEDEVESACRRLVEAGEASVLTDGRYVA